MSRPMPLPEVIFNYSAAYLKDVAEGSNRSDVFMMKPSWLWKDIFLREWWDATKALDFFS